MREACSLRLRALFLCCGQAYRCLHILHMPWQDGVSANGVLGTASSAGLSSKVTSMPAGIGFGST